MEEFDELEASWFDGSVEELIHELLDDESPLFVPPEVPESQEAVASQKSVINKLISSVYSGPTIGDIQSALSMGFQHGRSGSQAVISFPEKGSGKVENKHTLRIKSCGNGLTDDGYKWRKYGQKSIKNNPNPRSFFFFFFQCKERVFIPTRILFIAKLISCELKMKGHSRCGHSKEGINSSSLEMRTWDGHVINLLTSKTKHIDDRSLACRISQKSEVGEARESLCLPPKGMT